ncbi:MAG TPA: Hsp20/alpha crystallin family protein [Gammaproteobacteria bacterium]|nr:Hsp20/alpha crystallin family protein [Gammaproteobacteria bacterium]
MNVIRYEPLGMLRRFHDEVSRLFDEDYYGVAGGDQSSAATSHWAPAVDIKEEQDRYVLRADVPGVESKDIEITMENGVLTIKGERKHEDTQEREGYKRVERVYGTFYRRFTLPDTADAEKVSASSQNGVLEVTIPKQEKVQPRKIKVS